jgi:hypothetical protein
MDAPTYEVQSTVHYDEPKGDYVETPVITPVDSTRHFNSGARRAADADEWRYDLIPPAALTALARTYAEGARKYGDHNYLKGIPYSVVLNHLLRHIALWQLGYRDEDHLAHAAWGLLALMTFEDEGRGFELNDLYAWRAR